MKKSIKKYPVPLTLKKILEDSMNGELVITHNNFTKKLFFLNGHLAFASTPLIHERLGEILLSTGKITVVHLNKLAKIIKNSNRKTGEILMEIAGLNSQDIYSALLLQVKTIAVNTFSLTEGEWEFIVKDPEIQNPQKFNIQLAKIIIEGVKQIENISYFKKKFYYRSPVTTTIPQSISKHLTATEIEFHENLKGFPNTSVERIIPEMIVPEKSFWSSIIALYLLNIVGFVELTVDKEDDKNAVEINEINELYKKINSMQLDYYQLFGVEKSAPFEEIKNRYFSLSKKYHPDRITADANSPLKQNANTVFSEINLAYEILSDEDKRREYDTERAKQSSRLELTRVNQAKKARDLYLKAHAFYQQQNYFEAVSILEEIVAYDNSKASYFFLLGICQAKSSSPIEKEEAKKNLKKAAQMEPWNAEPLFALGELYRSQNLLKEAENHFKKASEISMKQPLDGKAKKEGEDMASDKESLS